VLLEIVLEPRGVPVKSFEAFFRSLARCGQSDSWQIERTLERRKENEKRKILETVAKERKTGEIKSATDESNTFWRRQQVLLFNARSPLWSGKDQEFGS
jgi:hypothetical protein